MFDELHSHYTLIPFDLFLCTVFLLAIRLPFVNKLELSGVELISLSVWRNNVTGLSCRAQWCLTSMVIVKVWRRLNSCRETTRSRLESTTQHLRLTQTKSAGTLIGRSIGKVLVWKSNIHYCFDENKMFPHSLLKSIEIIYISVIFHVWVNYFLIRLLSLRWRFGLVVTSLGTSTKLFYVKLGYYWDGWPFAGIPPTQDNSAWSSLRG